jgi:hypothetical protein
MKQKKTIEELEKELEIAENEEQEVFNKLEPGLTIEQFYAAMEESGKKNAKISRELRLLLIPEYRDLPTYGTVMSLKEFKSDCRSGGFIDYDGFGHYVKDGKESNITIYPSDVIKNKVRKDFDTIVWYNR